MIMKLLNKTYELSISRIKFLHLMQRKRNGKNTLNQLFSKRIQSEMNFIRLKTSLKSIKKLKWQEKFKQIECIISTKLLLSLKKMWIWETILKLKKLHKGLQNREEKLSSMRSFYTKENLIYPKTSSKVKKLSKK
jgi:hypothetical protein